jgi:hypothetical protein
VAESLLPPADEHLTTGWEPDLPADDTLVRQAVLVHASWPLLLAEAAGRPHRRTPRWAGAWLNDRGALSNPVVLLQPLDDPRATLAEIGRLVPPTVPFLLISAWPTPDLSTHGLVLVGHPPLMVRFPMPEDRRPPVPGPVEVREVARPEELALAERVLVEGYPMPEVEPLEPGDVFGPGLIGSRTRVWLAWRGDHPVAVSAAHHAHGLTLVEYVATLPRARGAGAGTAVTWAATLSHPGSPAVLIASDEGRRCTSTWASSPSSGGRPGSARPSAETVARRGGGSGGLVRRPGRGRRGGPPARS